MATCSFALLVTVALAVSSNRLGPDNDSQELSIYQQRNYILHQLLNSECPHFIRLKREALNATSLPLALFTEKVLYHRLLNSLMECRAEASSKNGEDKTTTVLTKKPTITTTVTASSTAKDCQELYERGLTTSGVYAIDLTTSNNSPFLVWCDFVDGHGWTAVQKRFDGSVNFIRNWTDYKNGFGTIDGEHWLGLDKLHGLTKSNRILNIVVQGANMTTQSGTWLNFSIGDETRNYQLTVTDADYSGSLYSSGMSYHNGMEFTTPDRDNDLWMRNCALVEHGCWWYKECTSCNINGWYDRLYWSGLSYQLVETVMRVSRD